MNPGPVEEAGESTRTYIDALKSQPVLLVQSLIIAGVVFILYAQGSKSFVERESLLKSVFEAQANVRDILSKCTVPTGRSALKTGGGGDPPATEEHKPLNPETEPHKELD